MSELIPQTLDLPFNAEKGGHGGKNTRMRERFSIDKPSDELLSKYYTNYDTRGMYGGKKDIDRPDSNTFFGKSDELTTWDFGCGRGEYVVAQAKENPDKLYVGVDEHDDSLYHGVYAAAEAELDNVHFVRAHIDLLTPYIEDGAIEDASVLFPAPIVQRRNAHKDVLKQGFIEDLHRTMTESGELNFASDAEAYFQHKVAFIEQSGLFVVARTTRLMEEPVTRYQKQWQDKGIPTNRAIFERTE